MITNVMLQLFICQNGSPCPNHSWMPFVIIRWEDTLWCVPHIATLQMFFEVPLSGLEVFSSLVVSSVLHQKWTIAPTIICFMCNCCLIHLFHIILDFVGRGEKIKYFQCAEELYHLHIPMYRFCYVMKYRVSCSASKCCSIDLFFCFF
jgi:hypothetical protein